MKPLHYHLRRLPAWLLAVLVLLVLVGLYALVVQLRQGTSAAPEPYAYTLPEGWTPPTVPPGAVPVTTASVELGRALFYDTRLTNDGKTTCATCHEQSRGFTNGKRSGVDASGNAQEHNVLSLLNVGYSPLYTWANHDISTIEQELALTRRPPEAMERLRADPTYRRLFAEVFPDQADPFSWPNTETALAAFVRTLISSDTPYDRYVRGDHEALSPRAKQGMGLFFSNNLACYTCHIDVERQATMPQWNAASAQHNGLNDTEETFLVPPLRNVSVTGPYMHDGRFTSLEAVIRMYEAGGDAGKAHARKNQVVSGFLLTDEERAALLAFLVEGLTDQSALTNPAYGPPSN